MLLISEFWITCIGHRSADSEDFNQSYILLVFFLYWLSIRKKGLIYAKLYFKDRILPLYWWSRIQSNLVYFYSKLFFNTCCIRKEKSLVKFKLEVALSWILLGVALSAFLCLVPNKLAYSATQIFPGSFRCLQFSEKKVLSFVLNGIKHKWLPSKCAYNGSFDSWMMACGKFSNYFTDAWTAAN